MCVYCIHVLSIVLSYDICILYLYYTPKGVLFWKYNLALSLSYNLLINISIINTTIIIIMIIIIIIRQLYFYLPLLDNVSLENVYYAMFN